MPRWKYVSNRFLTGVENLAFGLRLSEYHTGLRAYSRRLLETIPYRLNSDDFVFDQELIAQVVAAGMRRRIGEIAVPTRYFEEASSVGFKRIGRLRALDAPGRAPLRAAPSPHPPVRAADGPPPDRLRPAAAGAITSPASVDRRDRRLGRRARVDVLAGRPRAHDRRAGRREARWILAMLAFQTADVLLRGFRWQRLLHPIKAIAYVRVLQYLLIGYLANNILPARLGELIRSHYAGEREGFSRATALGTVVVERIVDIAIVVSIASLAIFVLHDPRPRRERGADRPRADGAAGGRARVRHRCAPAAGRGPDPRARSSGSRVSPSSRDGSAAGLAVISSPRVLAEAIVVSFAAWGMTVLAVLCAAQSLGLELTTAQASLLAAGTALAAAIPAGPSNLGTYDLAAVEILAAFGVDRSQGLAVALIAHSSVVVITSLGGAIALLRVGWARTPVQGDVRAA